MSSEDNKKGLSITTITACVGVMITWLLWGVACAMYGNARPEAVEGQIEVVVDVENESGMPRPMSTRGAAGAFVVAGIATFFIKTVTMLPQLPAVLGYLFRERIGFVIVATAILAGVILLGLFMKRLELSLEGPKKKRKRKKYKPAL
ncbi:hypothetical protein AYO47_07655 [Planctomyces sp. SCGC AG-212-M04]|nr:hypothetical protein AYO47_07655 [Planctomyces sp. SCGC AG-212-M04]